MILTSPPYDGIRKYGRHIWDHEKFTLIAHELWRITQVGGVVCWVVRDQIEDGSQTGTCFRQALFFLGLGFRLHNTIIVDKPVARGIQPNRYGVSPEQVFVFSKGKPRTATLLTKKNVNGGQSQGFDLVDQEGNRGAKKPKIIKEYGNRGNVWRYGNGGRTTVSGHTGLMPEALAGDLILSWSRPGDVVFDPLSGLATTAKMALMNDRQYLGFEVHQPYHVLALRRMADVHRANDERLDSLLRAESL